MKVVIAGAGIGGLATALMLHEVGIEVTVYESVGTVKPLGVGINLLPHAVAEFAKLRIKDEILALGIASRELCYANRHGQFVSREARGDAAGYPVPQISIHRGRLQLALLEIVEARLGLDAVRTGCPVLGFREQASGVEVEVADQGSARIFRDGADVFVGADGIHSGIRAALHPDEGPPAWSGQMMWRATTQGPTFLTGASMVVIGTRARKLIAYPITHPDPDGHALINWVAVLDKSDRSAPGVDDWDRRGSLADFAAEFEAWRFSWLDVPALMRGAEAIYQYPMVDRDPLPFWSRGRVTLLGDSAHPMYPVGSNGASQAVLDARALVDSLTASEDPVSGLAAYDNARRPATARVVEENRRQGDGRVLEIAEERAPNGFDSVDDIFAPGEIEQITADYQRVAGFTKQDVTESLETTR